MKTLVTQRVARGRRTSLTDSRKTVQKTRETCPPCSKDTSGVVPRDTSMRFAGFFEVLKDIIYGLITGHLPRYLTK